MLRMLIVDDEEHIVNALYGVLAERFDDIEIQRAYSSVTALSVTEKPYAYRIPSVVKMTSKLLGRVGVSGSNLKGERPMVL